MSTEETPLNNNNEQQQQPLEEGQEEFQPTYFAEKQEVVEIVNFLCEKLPKKHDVVIEGISAATAAAAASILAEVQKGKELHQQENEETLLFTELLQKISRFEKAVGQYQELSQLLKPHLEDFAVPLINLFAQLLPQTSEELASVREKPIPSFCCDEEESSKEKEKENLPTTKTITNNNNDPVPISYIQEEEQQEGDENVDAVQQETALKVETRLGQEFEEYEIDAPRTSWHQSARLVCFVCKVVGFKSVIGYFPHDVRMLEPCFRALKAWMKNPQARPEWEVRYCLLLWLSNLILVPFALNNIDSSASVGSLSSALLETALTFLGDSSKCREGAALFIGRLLTRPDSLAHRSRLMQEAIVEMNVLASTGMSSHVRAGGVLHAAAITFKTGQREELVGFARMLIPIVAPVTLKSGDARVCKTATKLLQRLGLALLPNRPQPWRYNKARTAFLGQQHLVSSQKQQEQQQGQDQKNEEHDKKKNNSEEEEENLSLAHLEQVEQVVDVLLSALGHLDTNVRYSAAKGLGRICERLPRDCADDIVSAIMDLETGPFAVRENDSNWHGATLALAEICRRYALLPSRFSQLVPLVEKALTYDVCKGSYSVGSHVRDAASYICWAAARSYNLEDLVDYVTPLSRALVTTALTDREVNVRRAASAAFQECAGRLGNFPHALDIITTVDFFALANLRNALLEVAPKIAWIEEYRTALFDRLLNDRIEHWSKDVREISAAALGQLCNHMGKEKEEYIVGEVIPRLCKQALESTSVNVRHGSVCALAEIVGRWNNNNINKDQQQQQHPCHSCGTQLFTLIPHLEAKRLFRGRGAEYIRQACCKLIENVSVAKIPVPDKISRPGLRGNEDVSMRATLQAFFEETCKNPLRWLQRDGANSMKAFGETFYPSYNEKFHGSLVSRLVAGCASNKTPNERRGSCLMLGALPASVLTAKQQDQFVFDITVDELCKAAVSSSSSAKTTATTTTSTVAAIAAANASQAEGEDAECREEAIRSLGRCCVTLCNKELDSTAEKSIFASNLTKIESAFLNACDDYATDRRGDIGLFVRLASLESYREIFTTILLAEKSDASFKFFGLSSTHLVRFVNCCLKQAMEKIDRVRTVATQQLHTFVESTLFYLSNNNNNNNSLLRKSVQELLASSETIINDFEKLTATFHALPAEHDFAAPSAAFDLIVPNLISCNTFCTSIVEGLAASVGCLTPHVAQSALHSMVRATTNSTTTKTDIANAIKSSFSEKYSKSDRICVPYLLMTERCLEASVINDDDILVEAIDFTFDAFITFAKDIQKTLQMIPIMSSFARRCNKQQLIYKTQQKDATSCRRLGDAKTKSLQALLALLATRFPKVRAVSSVELFTVLSAQIDSKDDSIENAQKILTETSWDSVVASTDQFKAIRQSLFEKLNIAPPENLAQFEAAGSGTGKAKKQVSELAMYKTLVAEKGF